MSDLKKTYAALQAAAQRRRFRAFDFFVPYEKQQAFFDLGSTKRERMLSAGNQQGKTHAGAFEAACHLTGLYPDWWLGRRWDKPTRGWACGETSLVTRDSIQRKLCGEPGVVSAFGTGMIPKDSFVDKPSLARGVTDAYDTVQVRHASGGVSVVKFKSYEQGREKFQAETLDWVWDDEEPPEDIYSEQLARISAVNGMIFVTFTPLKGMSTVVRRFLSDTSVDRATVTMTIDDAKHIAEEDRAKIIAAYPAHEREARVRGIPMLGEGRIFQVSEESITAKTFDLTNIPNHWVKLWGLDFGIGHPFAAVLTVWDKDNDVIYVAHALKMFSSPEQKNLPILHAAAMRPIGAAVPVAWPQDGTARESSGATLASQYKAAGLEMLPEHATWPDGGVSTEAGIMEMQERMETGRFKVLPHLGTWWEEFRLYHRKKGLIVKENDDVMSATRVAVMMKRAGRAVPLGGKARQRRTNVLAEGVEFNVFTGEAE